MAASPTPVLWEVRWRSLYRTVCTKGGEAHPRNHRHPLLPQACGGHSSRVRERTQRCARTPSDLLTVAVTVTFVVTLAVAILRLVRWRQSSLSGLRLLTGNRSQQAALVRALRP